ncbi:hypothetical protein B5C34_09060 [Pacificimonas flava]|uniref:Opine oxidase subunit A n=2 Tax=Pacificimonas TaxID=1960290 RepID=A0A219B5E7_9SPHN|nr:MULTISPECIES: FAD-dependent oxidoreductase [Pacificimonas]MBZ6379181.1 FAD-dependent oxidoreductase [Pacificimonas aurantium]OWV33595.1 hypothetical protein B5C34_09060 [Pacificimonas flava]
MAEAHEMDVAIVGGGPAGLNAALVLAGAGASVSVIDEQARPGGQILRQPPTGFAVTDWLTGRPYTGLKRDLAAFEDSGATWRGGRSVLSIQRAPEGARREDSGGAGAFDLVTAGGEGAATYRARHVLVAGGCQDLAVPFPGWTLPGAMTVGGLQAFVKSQRIVPGGPVLLAGTHPLMLVLAEQLLEAGARIAGVVFAQGRARFAGRLGRGLLGAASGAGNLLAGAEAMARLVRSGVDVRFGDPLTGLLGRDRVEAARFASGEVVPCGLVGTGYGFVPQAELVRQAGANVRPAGRAGGWAAAVDSGFRTSVPGLYAAGETVGVAGAEAARLRGRIAGGVIADALGRRPVGDMAKARSDLAKVERFADLLDRIADPRPYFPALPAETFACRCEDVSAGEIENAIAAGAGTADAVKLRTRCGMGVCQGRNCEPTLLRLLAAEGCKDDPGFGARFPARPVRIGDLID